MKHFLILISMFVGCAAPQKKVAKKDFLSGQGATAPVTEIKNDLTRSHGPNMIYQGQATLITSALIGAEEREIGKKTKDTAESIQKRIQSRVDSEATGRTCFNISVTLPNPGSSGVDDPGSFSNWRARAKGKGDPEFQELAFDNIGPSSRVKLSASERSIQSALVGVGYTTDGQMKNSTKACSTRPLSMESPIELILVPKFGDERFKSIEMSW